MSIQRVGVCSWSLQPSGPDDLIKAVAATGLDAVQLALTPLVDDLDAWRHVGESLADASISILSGMIATRGEDYTSLESIAQTGGIRPDSTWEANRSMAMEVAQFAHHLGITLLTFHAGFLPEDDADPERAVLLNRLGEIADVFGTRGVRLALETGQESAPTLLAALKDLSHPTVGVNFDPANMVLYGKGDPIAALDMLHDHIMQVHLKDATASQSPGTWGSEVVIGQGDVQWRAFIDRVQALPQDVNVVIEREAGETRVDDVKAAIAVLESQGIGTPTS